MTSGQGTVTQSELPLRPPWQLQPLFFNWASYGDAVLLPPDMPEWRRHLLTDPQTSRGLLVSCERDKAAALVEGIVADGYPSARVIGHVEPGAPAMAIKT